MGMIFCSGFVVCWAVVPIGTSADECECTSDEETIASTTTTDRCYWWVGFRSGAGGFDFTDDA